MDIAIKRVYEPYAAADGTRILVDRVWARGLSKASAHIDMWLKNIAPSSKLRTWFNHDPDKWAEFQKRYYAELDANPQPVAELRKLAESGKITLLYGAKDTEHNQAVVLQAYLAR